MKIDGDMAEIIGMHIGDGCMSRNDRYAEYYLGGDITEEREYHDEWVGPLFNRKVMIPLFNRGVTYKAHPKVGIYGFHIFNNKLVKFFEKLGICVGPKINMGIPKKILKDKVLCKRFIRGLFDTDGNIYFDRNVTLNQLKNNKPVIKLGTVSYNLARDVFKVLRRFGLNPRMKKPYKGKRDKNTVYTVLIYRKEDIKFYINKIGFKNSKHLTKWQIFQKYGYCLPHTTLAQRKEFLNSTKAL